MRSEEIGERSRGRRSGATRSTEDAAFARAEPCRAPHRARPALVAALGLLWALLAPTNPAAALGLPVDGGHTFALPLPGFTEGLEGVDVSVEGAFDLFFGLTEFPITGGSVEGPDGFIPFTGPFEHAGSSLLFTRGDNQVVFTDPVVDTLTLGVRADVDVFSGGSLVDSRAGQRVFNLSPFVLPALPLPLPGDLGGFGLALPTTFDAFGREILLDLLLASFAFETETILADALFDGGPLDLAGRTAAAVAIVAEIGQPVPEPAVGLLLLGGLAVFARSRRQHRD